MNAFSFSIINFFTGRFIGVVGFMAINDYHFYWNKKNKSFFFVGLDGGGSIMEVEDLDKLPEHVLTLTDIDLKNTLNVDKAKEPKSLALEMHSTLEKEEQND